MFRRPLKFTEEQLQEMERLYAEGYGCTVIGQQYGCLSWSVEQRLRKRGVMMRAKGTRSPGKLCRHSHGYLLVNEKYEHRRVMEEKLGRPLRKGEVVHHINGVRDDNRPENLELYSSHGLHIHRHHSPAVWGPQDYLRAIWLRDHGYSSAEIAKMLGRTVASVNNRFTDLRDAGLIGRITAGRKLRCRHGHPLIPENVSINKRGVRCCRTCSRRRNVEYRKRLAQ